LVENHHATLSKSDYARAVRSNGDPAVAEYILKNIGSKTDSTILEKAHGSNKEPRRPSPKEIAHMLIAAKTRDDFTEIRRLLDPNCDPGFSIGRDLKGRPISFLDFACKCGSVELFKFLGEECGANLFVSHVEIAFECNPDPAVAKFLVNWVIPRF